MAPPRVSRRGPGGRRSRRGRRRRRRAPAAGGRRTRTGGDGLLLGPRARVRAAAHPAADHRRRYAGAEP